MVVAMDTFYYRLLRLMWTILITLLSQCQSVSMLNRQCPQGQLMHLNGTTGHATCCYPTRCGVGEQVMTCVVNGTEDSCQVCGPKQNQSVRTSSFTMERCTDWPLDKDCRSVMDPDKRTWSEQTKRCMCNIEQGKKFDRPESEIPGVPMDSYCQRRSDTCQPGYEPTVDGGCRPCQDNYFQAVEGFNLCERKTNCTVLGLEYTSLSNATADNNCSEPVPVSTTKPSTTNQLYSVPGIPNDVVVVDTKHSSSTTTATTPSDGGILFDTSQGTEKENNSADTTWLIV